MELKKANFRSFVNNACATLDIRSSNMQLASHAYEIDIYLRIELLI